MEENSERPGLATGHLRASISMWQQMSDEHQAKQLINPFSNWAGASHREALSKDDPSYGRPVEGSHTERRGKQAATHISTEIIELCHVIADLGQACGDGSYSITFGQLFEAYTRISNKLVGMLRRARKQGLVTFEGEMLFQRRDDHVVITCVCVPSYL